MLLPTLVSTTAGKLSDTGEAHLKFVEKNKLYEVFERDYAVLGKGEQVSTFSYVTSIWKGTARVWKCGYGLGSGNAQPLNKSPVVSGIRLVRYCLQEISWVVIHVPWRYREQKSVCTATLLLDNVAHSASSGSGLRHTRPLIYLLWSPVLTTLGSTCCISAQWSSTKEDMIFPCI